MEFIENWSADTRVRYAGIALVVLGLLGGGWLGYGWYRSSVERTAFKDLAESIDSYTKTSGYMTVGEDQLSDSERAFKAGAEAHSGSVLYPFFLAFEADALIRLGKKAEAAVQLDKAVKAMDRSHSLYYLYALKAALVKIDTQDASLEKEGRAELGTLASDKANPLQDMALYYSALEDDTQDEQSRAAAKYQEIIAHGKIDSYWYQLADDKLKAGD